MLMIAVVRVMLVPVLGLAAVFACRLTPALKQSGDSGVVMRLPGGVSRFLGEEGEMSKEEKQLLPTDTEIVRMKYRSASYGAGTRDEAEVTLVLAGAERRSIHRPEVCLTGQGWTLLGSETVEMDVGAGKKLRVKDLLIEKAVQMSGGERRAIKAHYLYWFIGTDVTTPSHFERIWLTTWDSVTRNVNHRWAYASVMALVTESFEPEEIGQRARDSEQTLAMMEDLVSDLAPKFQKDLMDK